MRVLLYVGARLRLRACACVESLTGTVVVVAVVLWNKLPVGSGTGCYVWLR